MDSPKEQILATTLELLKLIEVTAEVSIEEKEGRFYVSLEGEHLGNIIGFHGETLNAMQLFLELALYRKTEKWTPISLDVGNYRKEREDWIKKIAQACCDKVIFFNKEVELSPMPAYDRLIVHTFVSENPNLTTESTGEGRERRVVIKPVKKDQA
ncbi:MAG: R3H domain-containing nucleic acid-binding protein [Patescibacteria group bacterium]